MSAENLAARLSVAVTWDSKYPQNIDFDATAARLEAAGVRIAGGWEPGLVPHTCGYCHTLHYAPVPPPTSSHDNTGETP